LKYYNYTTDSFIINTSYLYQLLNCLTKLVTQTVFTNIEHSIKIHFAWILHTRLWTTYSFIHTCAYLFFFLLFFSLFDGLFFKIAKPIRFLVDLFFINCRLPLCCSRCICFMQYALGTFSSGNCVRKLMSLQYDRCNI